MLIQGNSRQGLIRHLFFLRRRAHFAVEADAKPNQTGEAEQIRVKPSEYHNEVNQLGNKQGQQERVRVLQFWVAMPVMVIKVPDTRGKKPSKPNHPKNSKRNNHRKRPTVVIAGQNGSVECAEGA